MAVQCKTYQTGGGGGGGGGNCHGLTWFYQLAVHTMRGLFQELFPRTGGHGYKMAMGRHPKIMLQLTKNEQAHYNQNTVGGL